MASVLQTAFRDVVSPLIRAFRELQQNGLVRIAQVRCVGATAFLSLAALLGFGFHRVDWAIYVPLLAAYAAASGLLVWGVRRRAWFPLSYAVPFVDIPAVCLLQWKSLPISPFPAGVAGWSLGLFVFLVLLATLSLRRGVVVMATLNGTVCEAILQRAAHVDWAAITASAFVLALTASTTFWVTRQIQKMVGQLVEEEASLREATARTKALATVNARIQELNDQLVEAQRQSDLLMRLLVHDMRGPATAVISLTNHTLSELPQLDASSLRRNLSVIERAGERLLDMTTMLLRISKLEQGLQQPKPVRSDIFQLVHEVKDAFSAKAKEKGVVISCSVEKGTFAVLDRELIHRALDNLVSNGLRYVGPGQSILMTAKQDGNALILAVRNNGSSLAPGIKQHLFQKFSQASDRNADLNLGLGLYFCRLAAEAHRGQIALEETAEWPVGFVTRIPLQRDVEARDVTATGGLAQH